MICTSRLPIHKRHALAEGDVGPGQAGDALLAPEEAREAADLAVHVLLAAPGDEVARRLRADDLGTPEGVGVAGRTEHADGVVVGEHEMRDRLVRDLADARDHVARHGRRGLGVHDKDAIVPDDHARVGVALSRVSIEAGTELVEADLLVGEIFRAGEARHPCPPRSMPRSVAHRAPRGIPLTEMWGVQARCQGVTSWVVQCGCLNWVGSTCGEEVIAGS